MAAFRGRRRGPQAAVAMVALVAALLAGCGAASGSSAPARAPRWLSVQGTTIRDGSGRVVRLLGFDEGDMYTGSSSTRDSCGEAWRAPPADMAANISRWGFNAVRFFISWSDLEPVAPTRLPGGQLVHHWNLAYLELLDRVVASAHSHGVYLIPAMAGEGLSPAFKRPESHRCEGEGMPAWLFPLAARGETYRQAYCRFYLDEAEPGVPEAPLEGLATAWQLIAARYAHDPAVAAVDLLNEPYNFLNRPHAYPECRRLGASPGLGAAAQSGSDFIDGVYRRLGSAIRRVDPRVLLILEGTTFLSGQRLGLGRTGLRNVVYEWHQYPESLRQGEPGLRRMLELTRQLHVPLWLGEFEAFGADSNRLPPLDRHWRGDLSSLLALLRGNDVGWALESYASGGATILSPRDGRPKQPLLRLLQHGI